MEIARTIKDIRRLVDSARRSGKTVGLVPTLGALHAGHMTLIERARRETNFLVVSIFLNPTQFAPGKDLDEYPRQERQDLDLCAGAGVDAVFTPSVEQMYAQGHSTVVKVEGLSKKLCGPNRPRHFSGVTTIVAKLFNIVAPNIAYFGQKDAQQGLIIKRMVQDLDIPVDIRMCPTVREEDGLAMSSRNALLDEQQRSQARCIYQALQQGKRLIEAGQRNAQQIITAMEKVIKEAGPGGIDYAAVVDAKTLEPANKDSRTWMLALAVRIGSVRLIDNMLVEIPRHS